MNRPSPNEYPQWAEHYISLVEDDVLTVLERQGYEFPDYINSLVEKADYAYAPEKWTLKQLFGHMVDTERVFSYRIMSFARGEQQALPGFDENAYVDNAHFADRSMFSLSEEFGLLRKSNMHLYKSLNDDELTHVGTASGRQISVKAILFVAAGHLIHHTQIIKERYL
ncbi:MAG: DinB family protein [Pedobacter sp.]|nr:MAG: DinB family protein [Pedobacter sp.]